MFAVFDSLNEGRIRCADRDAVQVSWDASAVRAGVRVL